MQIEPRESVVDRLMQAYAVNSVQELADAIGESVNTVKSWRQRGRVPLEHLVKCAEGANRTIDWLVFGGRAAATPGGVVVRAWDPPEQYLHIERDADHDDELTVRETRTTAPVPKGGRSTTIAASLLHKQSQTEGPRPYVLAVEFRPGERTEYEVIPKHVGGASAGLALPGSPTDDVIEMAGEMAFTSDWLDRQLGVSRGRLASIRVSGDSMAPTILDGETIVIDSDVSAVEVSGIYVIAPRGNRQVKRIQLRLDGSLEIISDNSAYKTEVVHVDHVEKLTVVGRMVWPRVR